MDKEKLSAVGIDYENAIKRFAGNEVLYEKYLNRFTEDEHLGLAQKAMQEKNYDEILREIHTMKGVVGTLGMTALFDECSAVVVAIRANDYSNMEGLMQKVQKEYDKVITVFKQ